MGRSIIWVTHQAVFWLANRAALGRLPASRSSQWQRSKHLFAYSGGPAPDSHRLPVQLPAEHLTGRATIRSELELKWSLIEETPVPRRAWSALMQVGLRTSGQGCRAFSSVGPGYDPTNNGIRGVTPVNARLPRRGRPGFAPDSLFADLGRLPSPATNIFRRGWILAGWIERCQGGRSRGLARLKIAGE